MGLSLPRLLMTQRRLYLPGAADEVDLRIPSPTREAPAVL